MTLLISHEGQGCIHMAPRARAKVHYGSDVAQSPQHYSVQHSRLCKRWQMHLSLMPHWCGCEPLFPEGQLVVRQGSLSNFPGGRCESTSSNRTA
jgi:hypothetical protein